MSGPRQPDAGEDFHAEVSDLRSDTPVAGQPLPFQSRRAPRHAIGWIIGLAIALVVVVVAASVPGVRERAAAIIIGPTPTAPPAPTATRGPGDDLFYLLPNPPGVTVSLDGRALGQLPLPGGEHPLRLTAGRHTFTWRSTLFPLRTLTCQVSVPTSSGDSCPFVTQEFIPDVLSGAGGHIIALHESLAALSGAESDALSVAIGQAVAGTSSAALVQAGESFFYFDNNSLSGEQVQATQTLRATLNFRFLSSQSGYPEPCILGQPAIPCRFPGQDCSQVCTVEQPPASVTQRPDQEWIGAVMVQGSWTYTQLDGTPDAPDVGEQLNMQLMAVRITRDASGWHVTPIIGHTPGLDVADDPVCDPARYQLQASSWSFMLVNPPPGALTTFVSDGNLADGCAVSLSFGPPDTAGIFLQRFGVLSTINDFAHSENDPFPVADAAEQQLALRMLAAAGH